MNQKTLALNLVCHKEKPQVIERLLDLVSPYMDEIVIVHDGPASNALRALSKKYSAYFGTTRREYRHAAPARRLALAQTESDWIFVVDPDERPSQQLLEALRGLIVPAEPIGAYWTRMVRTLDGVKQEDYWHIRLFRQLPNVQWPTYPHSVPLGIGRDELKLVYLGEDLCIFHEQQSKGLLAREVRYTQVIAELLPRLADVPRVRQHLVNCLAGYTFPLAVELREKYGQGNSDA